MGIQIGKSINQRFIFGFSTVIGLILVVFTVVVIRYAIHTTESDLKNRADHIMAFSVKSLETAMWQYNVEFVKDYLNSLFLYGDVVFAQAAVGTQIIHTEPRPGYASLDFSPASGPDGFILRESDIFYFKEKVGTIRFALSRERISRQVLLISLTGVTLLLCIVGVISATMYVLFRNNILRPLIRLEDSARQIAAGDLETRIDTRSDDEIGQLAKALSRMMESIKRITASRDELNHEIVERERAEEKIRASLREKDVLLKEIHHRVKNNMQIIQSLLSIQADKIDREELRKPLIESIGRIQSMALIHENLYRSEDIARLDIAAYFQKITDHLIQVYRPSHKAIRTRVRVVPLDIGMDRSIACGLIMNELVSNALKYAFRNRSSGGVDIELKPIDSGQAMLKISDDGNGLPVSVDVESGDSMGLKIVRILVRGQLKGTLQVKTDPGTEFRIYFPIQTQKEDG